MKPGAGRLKKPYSEKKRRTIPEDTDEESESDEPATNVKKPAKKSSSKRKESTNQSRENTGHATKGQKASSGMGLPQRSNEMKATDQKPTKNTSTSANTAAMPSHQEGGSITMWVAWGQ